jgi:hypothetical protein
VETGASCRFVDIDPNTGQMSAAAIAAVIGKKTRAIIPVHMYGAAAPVDTICSIAKERGLYVIEDACQAIGAVVQGRKVGTWGDIGCYSFHTNKLVGAPSDGGMLVTNSGELAERFNQLAEVTWDTAMSVRQERIPNRLAPLSIPVLRAKLATLDSIIQSRAAQYSSYRNQLLGLLDTRVLSSSHGSQHSYRNCVLVSPHASAIAKELQSTGIHAGPLYRQSLAFFEHIGGNTHQLPNTNFLLRNHLILPMGPEANAALIEDVVQSVCRCTAATADS